MPKTAFGFDGDNAYYEALRTKVLTDEKAKKDERAEAERQRRASLGLPENEHKSRKDRKKEEKENGHGERKKSIGEKFANVLLNGARSEKRGDWEGGPTSKKSSN